jgi:hypothetical protein
MMQVCIFLPVQPNQAERFKPNMLNQDAKVTLSPIFSPDGNTIYFAKSECSLLMEFLERYEQ